MTKRFLRIFFSCILSMFIAILSLAGGLCHFTQAIVCNQDILLQAAKNSGYTQQLYEDIAYNWENLLSITGVETPEDIMAVLPPEIVAQHALDYLKDSYSGSAATDMQQLRSDLDSKIREYAYSHNIYATPEAELEQNINDLVDACISELQAAIAIPLLPTLLGTISNYRQLLPKFIPALIAGCCILVLFLFFLQKKKQDTLYYITLSGVTGGIILIGLPTLIEKNNIIGRLPFGDSPLKTLITNYLQQIVDAMSNYGKYFFYTAGAVFALYLLINFIIIFVKWYRNKNAIHLEHETE